MSHRRRAVVAACRLSLLNLQAPLLGQEYSSPRAEVAAILAALTLVDFPLDIRTDHKAAVIGANNLSTVSYLPHLPHLQ